MTDLKAQGFIEHDGGGMPDCYGKDERIEVIYDDDRYGEMRGTCLPHEINSLTYHVTHHRPHISEREQLDMAMESLDQLLDDMGDTGKCVCQQAKEEAIQVLATLRERKPT